MRSCLWIWGSQAVTQPSPSPLRSCGVDKMGWSWWTAQIPGSLATPPSSLAQYCHQTLATTLSQPPTTSWMESHLSALTQHLSPSMCSVSSLITGYFSQHIIILDPILFRIVVAWKETVKMRLYTLLCMFSIIIYWKNIANIGNDYCFHINKVLFTIQLEHIWLELAQRVWQCWRETQSLWCVVLTSLETPYPLWSGETIMAGQLQFWK